MVHPPGQAHGGQFRLGPVKGIGNPGNLHRQGDVFQGGHGGDQVKALKHHAHAAPAKAGKPVFIHACQVVIQGADLAGGCAFKSAHQHQKRRFAGT